jgi:citrate lyase beta subunit
MFTYKRQAEKGAMVQAACSALKNKGIDVVDPLYFGLENEERFSRGCRQKIAATSETG